MSKKMCWYYIPKKDRKGWNYCGNSGNVGDCPRESNKCAQCEIISAKPKYKTIKGWANLWINKFDGKKDVALVHSVYTCKTKYNNIPCEIRINTKYLKGGK